MNARTASLPKPFHDAVVRWRQTYLPDYDLLLDRWDRFFPNEPRFELCAFRELGMCDTVECGDMTGKPKATRAADLMPEQSHHVFGAIRAQASTEFGSIQQHRLTLSRAQEEEEQFWILRMMAEELRHGYQMLHLLVEDDWSCVTQESKAEVVEGILGMTTGSHILGAFNIDFDSFVDNVVFCALIDRVGKYQLAMQRISAYKPMAESMPQMLREEAFHLAAGVVPMRRWVTKAARGDVYITMEMLQKAINKWLPRALEMFGDERGGGTNVRYGLKPMKNAEAQRQYYEEVEKLVRDLNMRYVRARVKKVALAEAEKLLDRIAAGETVEGVAPEELLRLPHPDYFRRRGVPAFTTAGWDGKPVADFKAYTRHLAATLPESYLAGIDFREHLDALGKVQQGELTIEQATRQTPALRRVAGACPCSKGVRWVIDEPSAAGAAAAAPA